jgi:predicted metal-binding membrane protein
MDMPMGIAVRGAVSEADADATAVSGMGGMATGGMAADESAAVAMSGMSAGWTVGAALTFLVAWTAMMVAMMFPAAAPMILLFQTVSSQRRAKRTPFVSTWIFAAGYLLVWTAIGALTYALVQVGSELAGRLGAGERATWAPVALGLTVAAAGLYQLTPLKRVCLDQCRSPLGFVMQHWREGRLGALRMGVVHGTYCVGCCWALFAVLVAAGVMSLAWMLLLTLVVFAEKVLPLGRRAARAVGVALVILGIVVAAGAIDLPWTA